MRAGSSGFAWPDDAAFLTYDGLPQLLTAVAQLVSSGHVFVVSPRHGQVAMSTAAARDIGLLPAGR